MDDDELGVTLRNMSREQLEKLVLVLVRLLGPERRSDIKGVVLDDLKRGK